jgi:hypothetical protein
MTIEFLHPTGTGWRVYDSYYWDANAQTATQYRSEVDDLDEWWFMVCYFFGACDA